MELQRGICSLCSESGKVLTSSAAAEFLKYLFQILADNCLTESQFQQMRNSIKICSVCCYKLELSSDLKNNMQNEHEENSDISDRLGNCCHFCNSFKCVIKVKDDWNFLLQRTEGFLNVTDYPVDICYRCIFYFDTIFNFKTKLSYKFPQLAVYTKSKKPVKFFQKQNETPKRKSLSTSPPNSKKRKIFENCFTYLQPLCNENYHVDVKLKTDAKMYKKIAYVNLENMDYNKNKKVTPKVRPQIKIKLKKPSKKAQKEKSLKKNISEALKKHNIINQPYVKLCKSEEVPARINNGEEKHRSLSSEPESTTTEEKIDETPKAANTATLAPKRRVSLFADLNEAVTENSVEINNIVEKYIKNTTFNDSNNLELLQEIEDNDVKVTVDDCEDEVEIAFENIMEKNIEENGINEEAVEEKIEEEKIPEPNNDSEPVSEEQKAEEESELFEIPDLPPSPPQESQESLKKKDDNNEGNDFVENEEVKDVNNAESDFLTGSERKKKRVTFSADISFSNE